LLQHLDRGTGHEGVDLQILGLIELLFDGDVVRQAERGLAGDAEGDFGRSPCGVPPRAGQDQQGGGDDCTPSHDFPRIWSPPESSQFSPLQHDLATILTGVESIDGPGGVTVEQHTLS
jgi:hypothetical protein